MDAGHRQGERSLLFGIESEVGQVVGVGIHPVAQLLLTVDRFHQDGDALIAEEALVAFEGLASGAVAVGVARHAVGDLPEGERVVGVEQDQQQVGDPLEPVQWCHGAQSRGRTLRCRR